MNPSQLSGIFDRKLAVLAVVIALWSPPSAVARITGFEITSSQPYGAFASGEYLRLDGILTGEVSAQEAIPDLDKATKSANSMVGYSTNFKLIYPNEPKSGNGALLVDVPNRGLPISHALYNSPRERPLMLGSLDAGTGFLENRGFSIAIAHWELGEGITPPFFVDEQGQKRFVEEIGFMAVRDFAYFLRYEAATPSEQKNPLAGAVNRSFAVGYSQTSRFLKTLLINGFNVMGGKPVFDGIHLDAGHAGVLPLMKSGIGPKSVSAGIPSFATPEFRGVHEEPFTYRDIVKAIESKGQKAPLLIVTNMDTDYLGLRASLTRTGAKGTVDLPIPQTVRMYDVAGAAHLNIRDTGKTCDLTPGQLDWSPVMRSSLVHLDKWVKDGAIPPNNRLMPLEARVSEATILQAPSYLPNVKILVPKRDNDGNSLGGVRLPDMEAALGVYGGQNAPLKNPLCMLAGSYIPFATTKAEREASGDNRPSLEERYPGGLNDYLNKVRMAANRLVDEKFLLEDDAAVIINSAAESPLFKPTSVPPIFR
jgi:hypothetical protein